VEGSPPVAASSASVSELREKALPDALLQKAKETFDQGNPQAAIALLDQYRESYPSGSDEVYWLYGQFYEANSPSRDILSALNYYRRLVKEYPQSGRCNDSRRRIAYLERYYVNIQ
jgi:outer membrane protein assembly factor BamD (BamD/ComL family)